jgi:CheY-like chemotaxis protein
MPTTPHIIIADNYPAIRGYLHQALARMIPSATITAVADGAAALRAYQERPADLLIVDHPMRELTGLALTRRLRAEGATVPIILTCTDPRVVEAAAAAGASRFLAKPYTMAALRDAVRELLPAQLLSGGDDADPQ